MIFTFEISNPCVWRIWFYRSTVTRRFGFLWFAFSFHPIREDELLRRAKMGLIDWEVA